MPVSGWLFCRKGESISKMLNALPSNWDTMDKEQRHSFMERFNIMEFDGGLSEEDAALEAEAELS